MSPNVLVVAEQCWPEGGGGTLATYLILKLLSEHRDLRFLVLCGTRMPARLSGVRYVFTPLLGAPDKFTLWRSLFLLARQGWFRGLLGWADVVYVPRYCYPVVPLAKRLGRKVVVHLHDYQPVAYNAAVLHPSRDASNLLDSIRDNVRYEVMEHGSVARSIAAALLSPFNALTRIWLRGADEIICVSRRQAEIIAEKAPELRGKIRVVYNPPPDVPLVEKRLGDPALLYLGGDSHVKGFHVLLDASRRILKRYPNVKFLLTKGFRSSSSLLLRALNRRFGGAFSLLGYLKYEEVLRLHEKSYALLFPSIWEEPLPYAVMESMLAGTIPVASRVGGVPEIVENTSAEKLMFTPGNVDEFVDRIESVLSMSKEQLLDIGVKLRGSVLRRFNNEKTKQELLKIFTM